MLLALIVAAVLTVPPLGQRTISTSHEARFALLARDIVKEFKEYDWNARREVVIVERQVTIELVFECLPFLGRAPEAASAADPGDTPREEVRFYAHPPEAPPTLPAPA